MQRSHVAATALKQEGDTILPKAAGFQGESPADRHAPSCRASSLRNNLAYIENRADVVSHAIEMVASHLFREIRHHLNIRLNILYICTYISPCALWLPANQPFFSSVTYISGSPGFWKTLPCPAPRGRQVVRLTSFTLPGATKPV